MGDKRYFNESKEPAKNYESEGGIEAVGASYTTQGLRRRLKSRHVQMMAIGSNIGTGLFVGSGKSLHSGGPLALVMGFILISIALTIMMECLGEMSVVLPVSGSFTRYATRFYDPSLGFATGWQYWLAWVSVFGAEAAAFSILIGYWNAPENLTPLWISIFIVITLGIQAFPVRLFGEVEFWVSALKVVAVVMFIIVTWVLMGGAGPTGEKHGAEYWHLPGLTNGLHNGFWGMASVFVNAAFASGGVEMVGIVSGESAMPRWTLPRAIRTLMWRFVIFYVVSMLFLSFVVKYDSPSLIGGSDAAASPFVVAIKDAGIRVLPDILNAVVMICTMSVGSSSIYICSRTLHAMAEDGFAWKFFGKTDRQGRPWVALIFSGAIGIILAYLNVSNSGADVFSWFSAISGMAFFIAWLVIIACNWRFRLALKAQDDDSLYRRFGYRATWWPWLSILAFVMIFFMVICQFVVSVKPIGEPPSASYFFSQYIGVPIFLVMWAGYKVIYRTSWRSLTEVDLKSGRRQEDPEELEKLEEYDRMSKGQRALTYVRF